MKSILSLTILLILQFTSIKAISQNEAEKKSNEFLGMWTLEINDGAVGWLHVFETDGYLDGELLWRGGSVVPVGNIYLVDDKSLVATMVYDVTKGPDRKHTLNFKLEARKVNKDLVGHMTAPPRNGQMGEEIIPFKGSMLPPMNEPPALSNLKFGKPIQLFNGKNIDGWKMVNPESKNGFSVVKGELINNPVHANEDDHGWFGNLRTVQEFKDFNLKLEVNVPEGSNSGIYLKGMYEVQVNDSYGKELDSHHMGALYSRITPLKSAEKPAGEWQRFDITLCKRHVTVVLNGMKIIDNQPIYGPTGGAIIADVFAPGPIYLQGDHGKIKYRNIVLTPIL